jgi:L-iditol 2-dehydrogenase
VKAALFDEIKHMSLIEKDIPVPAENDVLIRVIIAGICGSEIHAYNGTHPFRKPPSILGHEVVGEVVQVGKNVMAIAPGDRVTIEPHFGCGECLYCSDQHYHLCKRKTVLGTTKWEGGFAEYVVAPQQTVYKVPRSFPPELTVLTEPLAVGIHAVKVADIKKGDKVAILGSGPIGLLVAVAALHAGAGVVCISDAVPYNLEVGKELGATHTVNVRQSTLKEYVTTEMGEVDTVFVTVGVKSVVSDALSIIKRKGKIISIALFEEEVPINLNQFMISEAQMLGSSMYTKEDFDQAIQVIASKDFPLEKLVTHLFPFERINEAMEVALTKKGSPIKVLVQF